MLLTPPKSSTWPLHANAALWGLGNGLTSTTLVTYLARELGAAGLAVGLIVASPNLAGLFRLLVPAVLRRLESRKRFSLVAFVVSGSLLLALPLVCAPGVLPSRSASLVLLVALWGLWHLAMFLGVIGLWSWIGDLMPGEVRGRFIGVRQSWLMAGQIGGMIAAGLFAFALTHFVPDVSRWHTLAWPAMLGAMMMLVSVAPLRRLHDVPIDRNAVGRVSDAWKAIVDRHFRVLLAFWCLAGIANGVSQAAQGLFPIVALQLPVSVMLGLQAMMHLGQVAVSPPVGRWADRFGSRPIMIVSQVLVSLALVFYVLATKQQPYWIAGTWLLWIAYAGLNVCLPHVMLRLSPGENSPPYIATYFALGGLATAISSVVFGAVFDQLPRDWTIAIGSLALDRFQVFFLAGVVLRLATVGCLVRLPNERRIDGAG